MESDQFLKSLFLIILKKDSLENWEEKKQSLTHSLTVSSSEKKCLD